MTGAVCEARLGNLRLQITGAGLNGLLVTHLPNIRYLTGFSGSSGILLVLEHDAILYTDFRYQVQAPVEVEAVARVEIVSSDSWARVWEHLKETPGVEVVGFEGHVTTVAAARRFEDTGTGIRFEPVQDLVERLRVRKDDTEVEAIREAARISSEALAAVLEAVRPGLTEREVAGMLEQALRRAGSDWFAFPTIVASGPRSALPHAETGDREIGRGDLLLLDFGARVDGYCADLTRTVVVGVADERQAAVYELVRDAQRHARENLRAGMRAADGDALARSLIDARGFADAFGHSLGHGLGLEVHEAPALSRANGEPLPEGAVVTVEPGIYIPGWGGVRIEDDVYITSGGTVLLSDGNTELVELR